jgi:hypothetical protein
VIFAAVALLAPWEYPHTVLPVLPPAMYELVTAPVPFVLGIPDLGSIAEYHDFLAGVCIIDVPARSFVENEPWPGTVLLAQASLSAALTPSGRPPLAASLVELVDRLLADGAPALTERLLERCGDYHAELRRGMATGEHASSFCALFQQSTIFCEATGIYPGYEEGEEEVTRGGGGGRVISDCHFRKTATEYDRKTGIKWLSCTEK